VEWIQYVITTSLGNTEFCLAAYQIAAHSSVSHIETENMKTVSTGENVICLFVVHLLALCIARAEWRLMTRRIVNNELKKRGSGRGLLWCTAEKG